MAGQGVRGDWQLRAAALSLCAGISHHLHLLSSPKGFIVFLLREGVGSRRQRTKTAGLWGPALRERRKDMPVWEVREPVPSHQQSPKPAAPLGREDVPGQR